MTPVPYYPPPRYTDRTPTAVPVAVKFLRAGVIAMLEWCSLRWVDNAPPTAWIVTSIIAALILAVLECRDWLNFKKWWYFRVSVLGLLGLWIAGVAISYATYGVAPLTPAQGFGFGPAPSRPSGLTQQQAAEVQAELIAALRRASVVASDLSATKKQLDQMVAHFGPLDAMGSPVARNPYQDGPILREAKYTPQEASDLITAISKIKLVIGDYSLLKTPDNILPSSPDFPDTPPVPWISTINTQGLDASSNEVTTYQENLGKIRNQLEKFTSDQTLGPDLSWIIGRSGLSDVDFCLAVYGDTLRAAKQYNAAPQLFDRLLDSPGQRCVSARRNFLAWRVSIMRRLENADHDLRSYLR